MKFTIALSEFSRSLQQILPAIPPKSTLYVLEHVHCSLKDGALTLLATDQELSISTSMNVMSSEGGEVLIPARKLHELIRSLGQDGMIDVNVDSTTFQVTLRTSFGEYFIKGMDVSEFPVLPEFPEGTSVTLSKAAVQRIANKTTFAVSTEEYRPAMTGVYFEFNGDELISVATDGYRLVKLTTSADGQKFPDSLHAIIPARTVNLLAKADSDVVLAINKTHAQFINSVTTITTRLIDEKFPSYDNVIPKDNDKVCVVQQSDLLSAIRRVSLFTSTVSPQVRFSIKEDLMHVSAEDSESGNKAKEVVKSEFSAEPMDIGFNYRYIEESLQHISSEDMDGGTIELLLSAPTRAVLIKPKAEKDTLLMLVMPMRIS